MSLLDVVIPISQSRRVMNTGDTASEPAAANQVPDRPARRTLTRSLPTDRISFDKQIAILKAYAAVHESSKGKPFEIKPVSQLVGMATATVAMANGFFVDAGFVLKSDSGFMASDSILKMLNAENGLSPETAPEKLRGVMDSHWSTQCIVPRLRATGVLSADTVLKILGEESGASIDHLGRVTTLLDYLVFSCVLRRDGGQIRLCDSTKAEPSLPASSSRKNGAEDVEARRADEDGPRMEKYQLTLNTQSGRRVHLECPPEITKSELERIKSWLEFQLIVTDTNPKSTG